MTPEISARDERDSISPTTRYRYFFDHQVDIGDDFNAKAVVNGQSDRNVNHDFFESEFRRDPQPRTFIEATQFWRNFSLDFTAEPQVNSFYRTIERLPDVTLTGLRQQIGNTPFFYETQSSLSYLKYRDGLVPTGAVSTNYEAFRADTVHQIVLPETFFGWLNVTPRVGGRFTHYGDPAGIGDITAPLDRWVFNTGAEMSFKASRTWPGLQSELLDMDGVRHIVEPSANYIYVPRPNLQPNQLPQFDSELPSYRLLPVTYPDYNAVDSVDSQNTIRYGLHNKIQTKRAGQVEDVMNWATYTDWRLQPNTGQATFSDLYNDLDFAPRKWVLLTSSTRYNVNGGRWDELYHRLTLQPGEDWSWSLGHRYLVDDPLTYGTGNNLILSTFRYRVNEDWGFRLVHQFEARNGQMQEQYYTIYRDLRSWTAALSVRRRYDGIHGSDYTVAVTFQLKAFPRFKMNQDEATPERLFGR
jgi:LPS-assembly protein